MQCILQVIFTEQQLRIIHYFEGKNLKVLFKNYIF